MPVLAESLAPLGGWSAPSGGPSGISAILVLLWLHHEASFPQHRALALLDQVSVAAFRVRALLALPAALLPVARHLVFPPLVAVAVEWLVQGQSAGQGPG